MSANDFTKEKNRKKAAYRLWVAFRFGSTYYDNYGRVKTYYSYINRQDQEAYNGLERLFNKLHAANQVKKASIYNCANNELVKTLL